MGLADVAELANIGLANIDLSLAGSGAHPAAPGAAAGGVCTEDAVQMLELMEVETGLDLSALIDTANWVRRPARWAGEGLHPPHRAGAHQRRSDGGGARASRPLPLEERRLDRSTPHKNTNA